jgi:hypothetical protein
MTAGSIISIEIGHWITGWLHEAYHLETAPGLPLPVIIYTAYVLLLEAIRDNANTCAIIWLFFDVDIVHRSVAQSTLRKRSEEHIVLGTNGFSLASVDEMEWLRDIELDNEALAIKSLVSLHWDSSIGEKRFWDNQWLVVVDIASREFHRCQSNKRNVRKRRSTVFRCWSQRHHFEVHDSQCRSHSAERFTTRDRQDDASSIDWRPEDVPCSSFETQQWLNRLEHWKSDCILFDCNDCYWFSSV